MPRTVVLAGVPKLAFPLVVRCGVDVTTDRVVHCQVRWYDPNAASFTAGIAYIDAPGPCTYTVIATGK
jgi:hypothetical protein